MSGKADALRHIEAAENILRDADFIQLPKLTIDEDPAVLRKKARLFAEKLEEQLTEAFLVQLDRALFEQTIQGKRDKVRQLIQNPKEPQSLEKIFIDETYQPGGCAFYRNREALPLDRMKKVFALFVRQLYINEEKKTETRINAWTGKSEAFELILAELEK